MRVWLGLLINTLIEMKSQTLKHKKPCHKKRKKISATFYEISVGIQDPFHALL